MSFIVFTLLIVFLYDDGHLVNAETVTITTKLGPVKGLVLSSDHGQQFTAFRGIRYAKSERFEEPKLFGKHWTDVYDATNDGPMCLQMNEAALFIDASLVIGQEDCLFLNVYRPQKSTFEKFPVMVFIHGGGYMSGSGNSDLYGPQRLMDKDIILVTFNYRLGPFGFLSTGDEFAPGNYGFLDQVTALRWVREFISDFGGDNQRVTIFGESAGSSFVSLHLLSTRSKGLFHGAILQSGNVLCDWGFEYRSPLNTTFKLATALECPTTNTLSAIKCLRQKPAMDVLTKSTQIPGTVGLKEPHYVFRPTMDKFGTITSHPAHLRQLLQNGYINAVPTISGVIRDEGLMFYLMAAMSFGGIVEPSSAALPKLLSVANPALMSDPKRATRAIRMIQSLYFNNEDESNVTQRVITMNKVFGGDVDTSTDNLNELLTKRGLPVYPYKLTYRGQASWIEIGGKLLPQDLASALKMVAHGDDLQYFFNSSYFRNANLNGDDQKMADALITLWTTFAKNKIPSLDKSDSIEDRSGFQWDTFSLDHPQYLDLNLCPKMVDGYLSEDRALWNSIYQYHYWNGQPDKGPFCQKHDRGI